MAFLCYGLALWCILRSHALSSDQAHTRRYQDSEAVTRRAVLIGGLVLTSYGSADASAAACRTQTNPLFSRRTCVRTGLQEDGRLLACMPSENCVSTSAIKSPAQFGPPWSYSPVTNNATQAFTSLVDALQASGLKVQDVDRDKLYVHATAPTSITGAIANDVDDLEFRMSPPDELVFYRSASREAVFFFPPQNLYSVPLSDGNSNRIRLETLRKRLGWQSLGPLYSSDENDEEDPRLYVPLQN